MIPFGDLRREYDEISGEIDEAVQSVCRDGWFVLGRKVEEFERVFAAFVGEGLHGVGVGSGTDAIHLGLVASGVGRDDYVVTVPNTAVPTISAISMAGAIPLFVDVESESFTMDPSLLKDLVRKEKKKLGRRLKAIIPVHLYGQSARMGPIMDVATEFGLKVIEDACQAHGALYQGRKAGSFGDFAAFSFYPSKNLGAYGDGGIVLTSDAEEAKKLRMLRNYGQEKRYYHRIKGVNSRLDEIQAAILLGKLKHLEHWNARRREIAGTYTNHIVHSKVVTPREMPQGKHVYHLYVIRHPERSDLQAFLEREGVQTMIHYPVPVHCQEAYRDLGYRKGDLPVSEKCADEILSLPIYPQLRDDEVNKVAELVNRFNAD